MTGKLGQPAAYSKSPEETPPRRLRKKLREHPPQSLKRAFSKSRVNSRWTFMGSAFNAL
jgi:hypothetical protein